MPIGNRIRLKIYNLFVNRVPAIQQEYHRVRQQKTGITGRLSAWCILLGMNLAWLVGKRKFGRDFYNPDENKKLPVKTSESELSYRVSPKELAKRLQQYDIISFDVFDTLLFRPFSSPTDLFFVMGGKLSYLDFERIRREVENKTRQIAYQKNGTYEVTISDIWNTMEEETGIPKEKGMEMEIETEIELCFGNPYMLEVFHYLKEAGKKIICISDMYLSSETIRSMTDKCGFKGISQYFISCECSASKSDGTLYTYVKERLGRDKTYIHVGDHPVSDIEKAKECEFATEFYRNVNLAGKPYRSEDMSAITGSVYRGLVNAHIHNGLHVYSREYELGFIYGGLFVLGYCRWIHEYVQTHTIDKILFLARDGDILHQVYDMLYPQENREGKTEYVYWSRLAATKMGAGYFKYDYFRRFLTHKVNQGYTMTEIFESMELSDMLCGLCREKSTLTEQTVLTDWNVDCVKKYLLEHWTEVLEHYEEQLEAGKQYYSAVLSGCRRVVAVDVGWAGSGAVVLRHLVQEVWKLDCEVIGLLAGTNSIHNAEPNTSEPLLSNGQLVSYLFSQEKNREIWRYHDAAKGHNLVWELLLGSSNLPFKGFYLEHEEVKPQFGKEELNQEVIRKIQAGIIDFVKTAHRQIHTVAGSDVYAVVKTAMRGNICRQSIEKMKATINLR